MAAQLSIPKTLTHKMEGVNMAVDIQKMVDAICSLTVLELSKLVKALRDKFGLRTSDTNEAEDPDSDRVNGRAAENSNESDKSNSDSTLIEPEDKSSDEPIVDVKDVEDGEVPECLTEPAEEPNEPKKESKPVPDPSSVPDPGPSSGVRNPSLVKRPEVEDFAFVYAWRYSGDNRYAKIGKTTKKSFYSRFVKTYHPTDDPILIGIFECNNESHALAVETDLLQTLKRTRPDVQGHEWVEIDEAFNKMIDDSFISDPNELEKIFGSRIETEKKCVR